jgi:uroporphyrin-III C-methyltransferase/precorrin-2 dehydrogenase/sirohydrochlorin ferrochelatase
LVGAGPGDPELLTLKALRALQDADVVLSDDLVGPAILDLARREARIIAVGKRGHGPSCRQHDINALMVRLARQGRRVVRLKAGDPMIFGRAGEEIAACRAAGVPVEVVPGISTPQGVAAALAVSLTHRDLARRVQFVTGHGRSGGLPQGLDFAALADPQATTIVYMPRRTWPAFAAALQAAGLSPATPALVVANATRPDQIVIQADVATLVARLDTIPQGAPTVILYGAALGLAWAAEVLAAEAAAA